MRRRRPAAASLAVSLFPFLAVLICTMGVLIVMLVLTQMSVGAFVVEQFLQSKLVTLAGSAAIAVG